MQTWNEVYLHIAEKIWISKPKYSWGIIVPGNTSNIARSRLASMKLLEYIQTRTCEAVAWALLTRIIGWEWRLSTLDEDLCLWFDYVIKTWDNTMNIDFTRWEKWFSEKMRGKWKKDKPHTVVVEVRGWILIGNMREMHTKYPDLPFQYMIDKLIENKWMPYIERMFPGR